MSFKHLVFVTANISFSIYILTKVNTTKISALFTPTKRFTT